ncbi:aarF domain-containing protein kinase 1 isoform X2 [Hibiscus syriacus]|uniref:aarF domain-containing protein kinase 1 isoform X2 n=1 Tax=Hibiscus syriacus TaxID=106335 RepID=UPI001924DDB8|nr:aarF domain-containing protein kinase 1 isoform X2 [Hibiscus syriacus]
MQMSKQIVSKFPARATAAFCLITAGGLSYQANFLPYFSDSSVSQGFFRSSRAIRTIVVTVADYKYSLHGLSKDCDEYRHLLSEVHLRSAKRLLKLCEINKGFYVKAGQFVSSLRQVPKEYSLTLSLLQDQVVPCDFKVIKEVIISNLGQDLSDVFTWLEEQPIAAASIGQVHHAMLKNHQEVAIKVQYPGLEKKMKLDTRIMYFLSEFVAWFFPEYRFRWLISEFTEAVSLELDFVQEARNSETIARNFKNNKFVRVPHIFWDFTTKQVLTMQFCRGHKVDDVEFLNGKKINLEKVAKLLLEVFAEMIFIHGFLHGDPHPVLLDFGICKKLDEVFRLEYCQLWKALILSDSKKIHHLAERFGVGKYYRYLPIIFSGRTIDSKSVLEKGMLVEEQKKLKQDLKGLTIEDISSFMESLPSDLLIILRTDELLRSAISKLGASKWLRLQTYGKYASFGLSPKLNPRSDLKVVALYTRLVGNIEYIHLRLAIGVMNIVVWMEKLKRYLIKFRIKMSAAGKGMLTAFFNCNLKV